MEKLITLQRDFMFATIFNKEENVSKLEKFIAIYFGYTYEEVHGKLELIKRDLPKNVYSEAKKQVDLLLTLDDMKLNINIEIDSNKTQTIRDRNTEYLNKTAAELGYKRSSNYSDIYENRQIAFNVKNSFSNNNIFIDEYRLMNTNEKIYTKKFGIDEINMELIDKLDYNLLDEKEKICYNFIKMLLCEEKEEFERCCEILMSKNESKELTKQVSDLSKDVRYIEMEAAYNSDKEMYDDLLKENKEMYNDLLRENKEMYEDLLIEEKEREFNKGISQGIDQGTLQTKIDTAKKMLEDNLDIDTIIKYTSLTKEEIEALK